MAKLTPLLLSTLSLGAAALLLGPAESARGFSTLGGFLTLSERDFRVFDNFADASANNNTTPQAEFPGQVGVELALWKGAAEWNSVGRGGDSTQSQIGDGGADFDAVWMGNATGIGNTIDNVVSAISTCGGNTLAFAEVAFAEGWRIRFCDNITWADGPGNVPGGQFDLQGVMTHEYGHALGLGHSGVGGATMWPSTGSGSESARSINSDDMAGVQFIYGQKAADKVEINDVTLDPQTRIITITGVFFGDTDNEVWFTPVASTPPGTDPRVRLLGVNATNGGTTISVQVPPEAGPGEVYVRKAGTGAFLLSNGFPLDPGPPPTEASTTFYNGSGLNPSCMFTTSPPELGASWDVLMTASLIGGGADLSGYFCHLNGAAGPVLPQGEFLVDAASQQLAFIAVLSSGVLDTISMPIPANPALTGFVGTCQGFLFETVAGALLCNGEVVTLGI